MALPAKIQARGAVLRFCSLLSAFHKQIPRFNSFEKNSYFKRRETCDLPFKFRFEGNEQSFVDEITVETSLKKNIHLLEIVV